MYLKIAFIGLSVLVNTAMAERFTRSQMDVHYASHCRGVGYYAEIHQAYALAKFYASVLPGEGEGAAYSPMSYQDAQDTAAAILLEGWGFGGFSRTQTANAKEFDMAFDTVGLLLTLGKGLAFQGEVTQKQRAATGSLRAHFDVMSGMARADVAILKGSEKLNAHEHDDVHDIVNKMQHVLRKRPEGGTGLAANYATYQRSHPTRICRQWLWRTCIHA